MGYRKYLLKKCPNGLRALKRLCKKLHKKTALPIMAIPFNKINDSILDKKASLGHLPYGRFPKRRLFVMQIYNCQRIQVLFLNKRHAVSAGILGRMAFMGADCNTGQTAVILIHAVIAAAFYGTFNRAIRSIHFKSVLSYFFAAVPATHSVCAGRNRLCIRIF